MYNQCRINLKSLTLSFLTFLPALLWASSIQSPRISLHVGSDLLMNDTMSATQSIQLTVGKTFHGTGYIKSPVVTITTDTFAFTGTIECDSQCTIIAGEPFDESMFTRAGSGSFSITCDPTMHQDAVAENISIIPKSTAIQATSHVPTKEVHIGTYHFTMKGSWHIAMTEAIECGDLNKVRALLQTEDFANHHDVLHTYLLMAGLYEQRDIIRLFIALGADVNWVDPADSTPESYLMKAIIEQKPIFVDELIRAGANPNAKRHFGISPLIAAVEGQEMVMIQLLLASPLIDLQTRDSWGHTPLMYAARTNNAVLVKLLLQAGADCYARDRDGAIALDYALASGNKEIQALLQQATLKKNTLAPQDSACKEQPWAQRPSFLKPLLNCPEALIACSIATLCLARFVYSWLNQSTTSILA